MRRILTFAAALTFAMAGAQSARAQSKIIRIDGSSTVFPVTEAVAEEFQKANRETKVTVGISGTGGGFKKFTRGEIDIADASRPISAKEMADAKAAGVEFIELPIAFDALTVMVNPKNNWVKELTVEDLKKIWSPDAQGKITRWNQIRSEWPDAEMKLYGAGSDSGTFDYFTEAIVGKAKSSRGDYTASEDDNVLVQGIANDRNALGYFGYAYYAENQDKLKAVPVVNNEGKPVAPSPEAVKDGSYNPLSRPVFIYVNKRSLVQKPEVKRFVDFYIANAPELVKEVKYVPLPDEVYKMAQQRVNGLKTGTAFGGKDAVGLKVDELFKRELKN
ncbi:MAG TPA: PstS family phosphate ABC transporter substrate-binding protein [Tepidisphaeraceae bacterium]|nr:PstS family phosphate ABC transporter substrate-binding protein [Tepidisphaeraceae bacterium]